MLREHYPYKSPNQYRQVMSQLRDEAKARQAWEPCKMYYKLVAQQAWWAYRHLPHSVRLWITIDDLLNHGMYIAYQYITKTYDPKRSKSITTGLHHVLHNFFIYEYIETHGAWKRGWHQKDDKLVSVQMESLDMLKERAEGGYKFIEHISELVTLEDSIINNALTKCFVIPAMQEIYNNASQQLKNEIVQWFWYRSPKVHVKGKPFQKAAKEFRSLAYQQKLSCDDCLHLVRSPECLDNLSREVFGIPYDLHCSPIVN